MVCLDLPSCERVQNYGQRIQPCNRILSGGISRYCPATSMLHVPGTSANGTFCSSQEMNHVIAAHQAPHQGISQPRSPPPARPSGPQTPAASTNDWGDIFYPKFHFFSGRRLSSPISLTKKPCGFISSIFKEV